MAKAKKNDARTNMRERAAKRANERKSFGSSYLKFPDGKKVNFFQPKIDKEYALDFLPYEVQVDNHPAHVEKGELWYQRTIWVHSNIGAEDKRYLCLKTVGKRCPICDYRGELMKQVDSDSKITETLKPKERELFQVIDLDDEAKGVQLFEFSYHLFGKMLEKEIDKTENSDSTRRKKTVHGGFSLLEGGQTLTLSFSGKSMGGGKPFPECDRIDADDRDDYDEDILEDVLDLDSILIVLPADKLEAILLETGDVEEKEETPKSRKGKKAAEEDEEPPARKRSKKPEPDSGDYEEPEEEEPAPKRGKRKVEPEPEDEEEPPKRKRGKKVEEEPEDEEEEPEEKPKTKRKKKPEPEDEEEEEPEEKPKRGRGKAKPEPEDEEGEEEEDSPKCYVRGGKFGVDTDKHTEDSDDIPYGKKGHVPNCFDCPVWDECKAAKDKATKKKK